MRIYKLFDSLARILRRPNTSATISLTPWERQVFTFFLHAAAPRPTDTTPPIELRVAGGWVRDKLLKRPAVGDIDIAIRHASGIEFAEIVSHYAVQRRQLFEEYRSLGYKGPNEYIPNSCSAFCIEPNPDNSRHLETASVHIDGHELDFVQLRTEDYVEVANHRIPSRVEPGSPYEDAYRRDFTVNALFYNLGSGVVEDWTGRGLRDLECGRLTTPLRAGVTLREDPLRGLRAIRFSCKLRFEIDHSLRRALCHSDLHGLLVRKVSRERIGYEIVQVVESDDPVKGLEQIAEYGLIRAVFGNSTFGESDVDVTHCYRRRVRDVQQGLNIWVEHERDSIAIESRSALLFALLANDCGRAREMLLGALKATKLLERDVRTIIGASNALSDCLSKKLDMTVMERNEMDDDTWIDVAQILHNVGHRLYVATLVFCSVQMEMPKLAHWLINGHGLDMRICKERPALDGHELQTLLGLKKGPLVGRAKKELMRLQLKQLRDDWQGKESDELASEEKKRDTTYWIKALSHKLSSH